MAKPAPGDKVDVPIVSFRIITDDKSLLGPAGVHSEQARSYGYNDFSYFERPEHYIRYIEPIESELALQVEYDMDEQDQEWLDAVNAERKKDQLGPVSYEVFEIIMDKLEKEWFNLIKKVPQPQSHMPVEDSKCAICDDGEGENSNAIVFCDGCNLAVHQDCYGVPYIPEGQWLCRKCTVSPENPVSCLFCPNEGGAFKQTTTGHWSHLLCAIWIPELGVGNAIYMEPVEGVENVPKNRWKLVCALCKDRVGACIQCEKPSCFTAFHVTCARQAGLLMSMKLMGADGQLKAYCDKHLPADWRLPVEEDDEDDESYHDTEDSDEDTPPQKRKRKDSTTGRATTTTITTKTARAHTKAYRPGPPIVPRMIVNRLLDYVSKVSIHKRHPFIERLCRYWSLKREARRGAPLLKRLHLEPWTATTESREQTDAEKAKKLEFLVMLRNDLEKVRLLAELVRKREKEKLRQAQVIKEIVDSFIFPHYTLMRSVYDRVVTMDREELFLHPVDPAEVPDYLDVVKEPISFAEIDTKIDRVAYRNVAEFKHDMNLVFHNALLYNKSDTPFYRRAHRMKHKAQPILAELDGIPAESALLPPDEEWEDPPDGTVGDLETSLVRLQALLAPDLSEPARDYLSSIFVSEVEKPKPPSPSPHPAPAKKPRKSKTVAERNREFADQEERYRERLAAGGSRTTRRAAEVVGTPTPTGSGTPALTPAPEPEQEYTAGPGPEAGPSALPRRRTRRAMIEGQDEAPSAASSPGSIKPMRNPERGVLGLQSIPVLTDRQRREQERRLDLVATSLDARDEYKRFNVGWILPEGSKRRRGAAATDSPKAEKAELKSEGRASVSSRASSKRKASSTPEEHTAPLKKRRTRADSDDDLTPVPSPVPDAVRSSLSPLPEDAEAGASTEVKDEGDGEAGDEDAGEAGGTPKRSETPKATPKTKPKTRGKRKADADDDPFPPGTRVWAKLTSYPHFPAVVVDHVGAWETVPQSVLDLEDAATRDAPAWLVRFYDKSRSYGWIHADKLHVLGTDDDAVFLAGKEPGRSKSAFKSSHTKQLCKKAYELALESKDE